MILGNPLDADWLRQSANNGKIPVKATWLYESVEEGEILDLDKYRIQDFQVVKKRGRPSVLGGRHVPKTKDGMSDSEAEESESEEDRDERFERPTPKKSKDKEKIAVKKPTISKKEKAEKAGKADQASGSSKTPAER